MLLRRKLTTFSYLCCVLDYQFVCISVSAPHRFLSYLKCVCTYHDCRHLNLSSIFIHSNILPPSLLSFPLSLSLVFPSFSSFYLMIACFVHLETHSKHPLSRILLEVYIHPNHHQYPPLSLSSSRWSTPSFSSFFSLFPPSPLLSVMLFFHFVSFSLQLLAGVCIGKFTKGRKFRLQVTALDLISKYSRYKIWLKPGGEQAFVYGNHVIKVRKKTRGSESLFLFISFLSLRLIEQRKVTDSERIHRSFVAFLWSSSSSRRMNARMFPFPFFTSVDKSR